MKSLTIVLTLLLCGFTFNIFAQDDCIEHEMPQRDNAFFLYGVDIVQEKLDAQIKFQVKLAHHVACKKDGTNYKQIQILSGIVDEKQAQINEPGLTPDKIEELEKALQDIKVQLSKYNKEHNALHSSLTSECKIPPTVNPVLNAEMPKCLTLLKQQLELEVKQYPLHQSIPEDANAERRKKIEEDNLSNENKRENAISDLRMVERLLPTENLEESPSSIGILKNKIRESDFGPNTNVLLDILDAKSAEIAIFRQKIKVLERNTRVLISQIDIQQEECNNYKGEKKKVCLLANNLTFKLNRTLELSYDDSWFENKNIENDIKDIESLLVKLNEIEKSGNVSEVKRINFLNHANQYITKYNGTGRFNIGLGLALFNAPEIINPINFTVNLSEFTSSSIDPQLIQDEFSIPSGKKLSPVIVATMPWVDATLTLPSYSKNSTYISGINTWPLPLKDEQTQRGFLSRTTIDSHYEIDYDINMTVKVFSILQEFCPVSCFWVNNKIKDKKIELALGIGTTDIQLSKTFKTDVREQINLDGGYSQLASLHQLDSEEIIDYSMRYWYVGANYFMADQVRLEAYWKGYKREYKKGAIQLTSESKWGISIAYLFF